jgi:7,8-dihydroneopterin aldolase/epimerase/oxygenase
VGDRIVLANMRFMARHGVHDWEQREAQPFEVDVELHRDLRRAGTLDDLDATIDYGPVYATVQRIVEGSSVKLLEALATTIAEALLADLDVTEVVVRVRKPAVKLGGPLDYAGVEIRRARDEPSPPAA